MDGEDIDSATVAVMVEADFDASDPTGGAQQRSCLLDDRGVDSIGEAVEIFAMPSNDEAGGGVQGFHQPGDRSQ